MREVELPNGAIGEFPDHMSDDAIAAVLSKQFAPKKSFADNAIDAAKNLGTGLATGAGQLGAKILAPYDLAADAVQGRALGTGNRERAASIEQFGKDHADTDSINYIAGTIAPEMAATAGPTAKAGQLVGQGLSRYMGRLAPAAGDAIVNAAYGAANAKDGERDTGAAVGAAGAVGGRVLQRALGGVARPFVSKDAQTLIDAGVTPTPGQLFGEGAAGRAIRSVEDSAQSLPIAGSMIRSARERSVQQYNNVEINKALKPIGASIKGAGEDAVSAASDRVSRAFDTVLPSTFLTPKDATSAVSATQAAMQNIPLLTTEQEGKLLQYVARKIQPTIDDAVATGKPIDGRTAKAIDSELGYHAREFSTASDPSQHALGDAFYELQASLRGALQGTTPDAKGLLQAANQSYRELLPAVKAADRAKAQGGTFTPLQYDRAAQTFGQEGGDVNKAARRVLPSKLGDSGTADRLGIAAAVTNPGKTALATLFTGALYSKPGVEFMVNGLRGAIPDAVAGQLMGMPPQQAIAALTKLGEQNPAIAHALPAVAAQLAQRLQQGQGASQ